MYVSGNKKPLRINNVRAKTLNMEFNKFILFPPSQRLDFILKHLNHGGRAEFISEIETAYRWDLIGIEADKEVNIILNKLVKDGNVLSQKRKEIQNHNWIETGVEYYISFEGKYLLENGGYTQKIMEDKSINTTNQIRQQRQQINNWIVAVGAIVAGLYYGIQMLKDLYHFVHSLNFGCH